MIGIGARGPFRDDLTGVVECGGQRCVVWMGSTRIHHREGQGDEEVTEGQTRLDGVGDCGWGTGEEEVRSMEILEVLILSVQLDNSVSGQYMADRRQVETMETLHQLLSWDDMNFA